jgi:ABC-2 type transport system permease protein
LSISQVNPIFFAIDGFRYGALGIHEGNLLVGAIMLAALNVAIGAVCWLGFSRGWRMKA